MGMGTSKRPAASARSEQQPLAESERKSLQPIPGASRSLRQRLSLKDEFILATLPTVVVLVVLAMVEALSQQRVLFASLASSAFLIYLDPQHGSNSVRSLVLSHLTAAVVGAAMEWALGAGYGAAGAAMVIAIVLIIAADAVHPPAVGTALSFAFRPNDVRALSLFVLCLLVIATLVILQRTMLVVLGRLMAKEDRGR
jgi:CBS-domain-containing membrane protein